MAAPEPVDTDADGVYRLTALPAWRVPTRNDATRIVTLTRRAVGCPLAASLTIDERLEIATIIDAVRWSALVPLMPDRRRRQCERCQLVHHLPASERSRN